MFFSQFNLHISGFMMPAVISAFTKCEVIEPWMDSSHWVTADGKFETTFSVSCYCKISKLKVITYRVVKGTQPGKNSNNLKATRISVFRWGYAFWIFAGLCFFGMLVFLFLATTEVFLLIYFCPISARDSVPPCRSSLSITRKTVDAKP